MMHLRDCAISMRTRLSRCTGGLGLVIVSLISPCGAMAQTGDVTLSDALVGSTYDVIVSIRQTGSTAWKLGMATFAFTFDPMAIQYESELEEGNWDNNKFPAAYGDQFSSRYTLTGARSVEVDFIGSNGSGVFLSLLPTVVGKLRFNVLDAGRSAVVRWQNDATVIYDDQGVDRTSAMTFDLATAIGDEPVVIPATVALEQNYPNPFNPSTSIQYALPGETHVALTVYNLVGEQVAVLVDERQQAGYHTVSFNAASLPSGMYVYRLTAGGGALSRKLLLVK